MKIIHLITRFNRGGTAKWLVTLFSNSHSKMHQELYSGFVEDNETEDENFQDLNGIHLSGLGRNPNLTMEIKSFIKVRKAIKYSNANVINTHTSKAGLIGRLAALSLGKKRPALVHTFHGHILYGYFKPFKIKIYTKLESILAKHTDVLISAGQKVKHDLLAAGVGKPDKYFVVNPGVKDLNFESRDKSREILKISSSKIVVGWLGRLEPVKAPERVLELAKEFPNVKFLIGGEGSLYSTLKHIAPKNVSFLGWSNPEFFWPACDIALLTSLNEAQPLSVIEAAKCSLPTIAEDVGSVSEVVIHEATGFLTNTTTERLAALDKLVQSHDLRKKLGNSARKHVEENYSIENFISLHVEAYKVAIKLHNQR